ncbi:hypothetical protein B7486_73510, partial [cyanobacterium TDX16]
MGEVVAALRAQQDELAGYVEHADADQLLAPSRCPGWSVADVLLHLAQSNEAAVSSVLGSLPEPGERTGIVSGPAAGSVDDLAGAMVEAERTSPEAMRDR